MRFVTLPLKQTPRVQSLVLVTGVSAIVLAPMRSFGDTVVPFLSARTHHLVRFIYKSFIHQKLVAHKKNTRKQT